MIRGDVEERFVGAAALDREDERIGTVSQVFVDDETEAPIWASVRVPLLGREVLVPLDGAAWDERALHLAIAGPAVLEAPCPAADAPTDRDQERLYTHYGIPSVRTPRSEEVVAACPSDGVCYSVRDDEVEALVSGADAIREAELAAPATVSGHML